MSADMVFLAVIGAIVVVWVLALVRVWLRLDEAERPEPGEWLEERVRATWPIVALLVLPPLWQLGPPSGWIPTAALGLIALGWIGEWISARKTGTRPERNPLTCAGQSLARIWRSPWLIVALTLYLIAGVGVGQIYRTLWARENAQMAGAAVPEGPPLSTGIRQEIESWPGRLREQARPERLTTDLTMSVYGAWPQYAPPLRGTAQGLLAIVVAVLFGWLYFRPPEGLPEGTRKRAAWPFWLTVLNALMATVPLGVMVAQGSTELMHRPPWGAVYWGFALLSFVWFAPVEALGWQIILQVVRGQRWDLRSALSDATRNWPVFVTLLLVASLPEVLFLHIPSMLASLEIAGSNEALNEAAFWLVETTNHLYAATSAPVHIALALAPLLIAQEGTGLRRALARSWRLAVGSARAVLVFGLRFALLFALTLTAVGLALPGVSYMGPSVTGTVHEFLGTAVAIVQVLTVGVFYMHLRD